MAAWVGMIFNVAAILLTGWILIPPIMYALGLMRLKLDVREDPTSAVPKQGDPDYERRYQQFRELGFVPAGVTSESGWFISPFQWHWRKAQATRWLVSADGRTFVSFDRLIREEPIRFGACTIFDGDALVRTSCPGAGIATAKGDYRRFELRKVEPGALLAAHAEQVEAFSRDTGKAVRPATVAELANAEVVHARRLLLANRQGLAKTKFQLTCFGLPSLLAFMILPRSVGLPGQCLAVAICIGAAVFAYVRFVLFESVHKQLVLRSHSEDVSGKPKGAS